MKKNETRGYVYLRCDDGNLGADVRIILEDGVEILQLFFECLLGRFDLVLLLGGLILGGGLGVGLALALALHGLGVLLLGRTETRGQHRHLLFINKIEFNSFAADVVLIVALNQSNTRVY